MAEEQSKDLPLVLNKCSQLVSVMGFEKTLLIVMTMDFACTYQAGNPNVKLDLSNENIKKFADGFLEYYEAHPGRSYCTIIKSDEYDVDIINLRNKDRINNIEINIQIDDKVCKESLYH
jgi:hypothetical protein